MISCLRVDREMDFEFFGIDKLKGHPLNPNSHRGITLLEHASKLHAFDSTCLYIITFLIHWAIFL